MKPVLWPSGDGIHTTSPSVTPRSAAATRTLKLVVCSVCMMALGVASVPEVKMSSETAAASRSAGSAARSSRASTSSSAIPWRGAGSHTTCTSEQPVALVVAVTSSSWSKSRCTAGVKIGARPRGREHVGELTGSVVGQQGVDDRPRGENAQRDDRGVELVRQLHRHDVAGADALGGEEARDPRGAVPQLGVGEVGAVLRDHGAVVGPS